MKKVFLSSGCYIFVGSRQEGKVYALIDNDKDHKAETVKIIASGLRQPNRVAY